MSNLFGKLAILALIDLSLIPVRLSVRVGTVADVLPGTGWRSGKSHPN